MKNVKKKFNYSSFAVPPPRVKPVKFDQVLSREKAMKPFIYMSEGAPFWKYNVKDNITSKPVKTYKISENPALNHNHPYAYTKEAENFKCGRLHKKI